jgi:hypothetical protein
MALNWTMLNPGRTPVPLPREDIIMTVESGAEVSLTIPDTPPTGSSNSGGSGGGRQLNGTGKLFLTDQRVRSPEADATFEELIRNTDSQLIFVSESDNSSTGFNTLTLPLPSVVSTRFEQPTLGSNYLSIDIQPSPDGGLTSGTKLEIRLKGQGIFQFVSLLEKTRERAKYMRRQIRDEEESLRKLR